MIHLIYNYKILKGTQISYSERIYRLKPIEKIQSSINSYVKDPSFEVLIKYNYEIFSQKDNDTNNMFKIRSRENTTIGSNLTKQQKLNKSFVGDYKYKEEKVMEGDKYIIYKI